MTLLIVYLLGSLFLVALCSTLETSLMSTPYSYVSMKEGQGYAPAKKFKKFKQSPSRPIAAILLVNTIAAEVGAIGVGHQVGVELGSRWLGVVSAIMTVIMLFFAEILPKTFAATNWKHLMGFTTRCLNIMIYTLFPIVVIVEWIGRVVTPKNAGPAISREEVSAMANEALQELSLNEDENTLIQNIISIDQMRAEDAMTPRVVCAVAPESMTVSAFYGNGDTPYLHHSRIPVYAESEDFITGYVLLVDALKLIAEGKGDTKLGSIRRDIDLFTDDVALGRIWDTLLENKGHISCLIDKYGAFRGILTLEDIVETLLGTEIVNEIDMVADMQQFARDQWEQRQKKTAPKAKAAAKGDGKE